MAKRHKAGSSVQWAIDDGKLRPVGATQRALTPGIYTASGDMAGPYLRRQEPVGDSIVESGSSAVEQVRRRVRAFVAAKEKYISHGVVHKTGILIYGPPGSGKTVLVESLAQEFVQNGSIVLRAANNVGGTTYALGYIRQIEPERLIVVTMEDIENDVEDNEEELLALLDGANQINGVVFLATTNYLSKLPPRIINRPSRFDERVYVGMPDFNQRLAFLKIKASTMPPTLHNAVAEGTDGFSYAHLKEVAVAVGCLDQNLVDVIERLRSMMEPVKDDGPPAVAPPTSGPPAVAESGGHGHSHGPAVATFAAASEFTGVGR